MKIESTTDSVVYKMVIRDKLRAQLASIIGAMVAIAIFVLIPVCLRPYKYLASFLGIWKEPTLIDVLAMCSILPFVALLIGLAVRWMLIYRWVAK